MADSHVRKNRKFPISAEMQPSAAAARTSCESAFRYLNEQTIISAKSTVVSDVYNAVGDAIFDSSVSIDCLDCEELRILPMVITII